MSPKHSSITKFDSPVFKLVPKDEVPAEKGRGGKFNRLTFYPEILRAFAEIKREGVTPFEDAVTIDLDKVNSKDRALLNQKNPAQSFYIHLRVLANRMEISKYVEVRRIGDKIHLVGAQY